MSNQLQITGGAKVRNLQGVITGTSGVLGALGINVPDGIPQLDGSGKILVSQLPNSVMEYKGTWNVATNTPYLVDGVGNAGDVYIVTGAATGGTTHDFGAGPILFYNGDQAIYDGSLWQRASGSSGTVTSVAMTTPTGLSVTGSPITTSGTLALSLSSGYVIPTTSFLNGLVPYTGATQTVDLGSYDLNARGIKINGTGGLGHADFKHQSGTPTGSASSSTLYADTNGNIAWLNDHSYTMTLAANANTADRTYTFPNASGTIALTSDISYPVTSVFGRTGVVTAQSGDYTTTQVTEGTNLYYTQARFNTAFAAKSTTDLAEGTNLYFTNARARAAISLTTTGTSGVATYNSTTGVLNIPNYSETTFGTVTSVGLSSATSGVTIGSSPITTSGTITLAIATASSTQQGLLSSTDWTTFNNKQSAITLTTTGSSGAATFSSNTLNVPNYTLSGLGGVPTSRTLTINGTAYDLSADRTWSVGTLTGGGADGRVAFWNGASNVVSDSLFVWDDTNNRLGINTSSPLSTLQVVGTGTVVRFGEASGTTGKQTLFGIDSASGRTEIQSVWQGTGFTTIALNPSGGNVGIGLTNPQRVLEVYSATADTHLRLSGAAPSVSMGEAITGSIYQAKFGLATASNQFVTGSVAGDFVISNQTGSTIWAYNSSEIMRINTSGNLGINTSNPTYKLDVNGTGRFSSALTLSGGTGAINFTNNTTITNTASSGYTAIYANGGGVYLGGSASVNHLSIASTGAATFSSSVNISGGSIPSGNGLKLYFSGNTGYILGFESGVDWRNIDYNGLNHIFRTYDTERMRITSSGNVGIGTTSPLSKLHVNGTMQVGYVDALNSAMEFYWNGASSYGRIQTYSSSALALNPLGNNVGIGTSSPSTKLTVYGGYANFTDGTVDIYSGSDGSGGLFGTISNHYQRFITNNTERMRITSGGYVLVGYTSPPSVAGLFQTTSAYVGILGTGVVYSLSGVLTSTNPSDLRLKDNVEDLGYGLKEILQLRPVKYNWKNDNANQGKQFGFIAQEVQEVMPELVTTFDTEDGERLGLEKEGIYAALVQAIKELKAEIDELKNK